MAELAATLWWLGGMPLAGVGIGFWNGRHKVDPFTNIAITALMIAISGLICVPIMVLS